MYNISKIQLAIIVLASILILLSVDGYYNCLWPSFVCSEELTKKLLFVAIPSALLFYLSGWIDKHR